MARVFISYRRGDREVAGLLRAEIARRIGSRRVFMDTRDVAPGDDFVSALTTALDRQDTLLVVVGDAWRGEEDRLSSEDDWVRREITAGLQGGATVVPVVVGDARWPVDDLPEVLKELTRRQAYKVGHDDLDRDVSELLSKLGIRARRRWPAVAAGVLALAAVLWIVWPRPDPGSLLNTQIVFDGSSEMLTMFPGADGSQTQKLQAARSHVIDVVEVRGGDHMGLRVGAGCPRGTELLVPLQREASGAISVALRDVTASDSGFPIAEAIIAATADFADPEKFGGTDRSRQIIVVTSAGDHFCSDDYADKLASRWAELDNLQDFDVKVDLIGLGVSEQEELQALASVAKSVGGDFYDVQTESDLANLLNFLIDMEPVITAAQAVVDLGNEMVQPINSIGSGWRACDPTAARDALKKARDLVDTAREPMDSLKDRDDRPDYQAIHAAGVTWVETLDDSLAPAEDLVELTESLFDEAASEEQCDEFLRSERLGELVAEWNERVRAANDKVSALGSLVTDLQEKAFELLP